MGSRTLGAIVVAFVGLVGCAKGESRVAPPGPPASFQPATPSGPPAIASTSPSAAASESAAPSDNVDLATARAIRSVALPFLQRPVAELRQNLPSDFAAALPTELGEPRYDSLLRVWVLLPWHLIVRGEHASLRATPPGGVNASHRVWFELALDRRDGAWQISPHGVTFAHAWARR